MIGFRVQINDEDACTAALPEEGVVSAILSRTWRKGEDGASVTFDLGGLDTVNQENLKWLAKSLTAGDSLTIHIVDVEQSDEPSTREKEDPDFVAKRKREYYERLKKEYGDA